MNVLNVVLSGIVSAIFPLLSIKNFSSEKINKKIFIGYICIYFMFLTISYLFFDGLTRLLLNIIIMITSLYFSLFKKNISDSV